MQLKLATIRVAQRLLKFSLIWIVLCCLAESTFADDWPRWMGPKMDGVWREKGMIDEFAEDGAKILWRQPIGGGYGGPSVVGNHLYVMDRTMDGGKGKTVENGTRQIGHVTGGERVQCLDVSTGEQIWAYSYRCAYKVLYPNGPRCTPTVDGDYVYSLGAMGKLICFNRMDGDIVWKHDLLETYETEPPVWGYASHPMVYGDLLLVPVGGKGSAVVAFNKLTGKEVWRSVTTRDVGYAPLVVYSNEDWADEKQLIFWHSEGVVSINPVDGKEYWTVKFPEERSASDTTIATPRLIGNKLLISEFYKGSMVLEIGSNPPSVKEVWRRAKLAKAADTRDMGLNSMMATPVIKDGMAIGVAYDGGKGVLRSVNVETGDVGWTEKLWMGGDEPVMFATGFIVENEDKYFVANDLGELQIVKLSADGFQMLDKAKILEPTTAARGRKVVWCHPAYADGKMYTRNDEEIVCVDLRKPSPADEQDGEKKKATAESPGK